MLKPYVLCRVGETDYAIPAEDVEQLEMIDEITRVPDSPPYLEGVVYLRGRVVPVVNLRRRFGLPCIPYDLAARLVVVREAGRLVALAVDSARDYKSFAEDTLEPPPESLMGYRSEYLGGVFHQEQRLLLVLDIPRLLAAGDTARPQP